MSGYNTEYSGIKFHISSR
ncbi:MAG: hypothetical protein R3D26_24990 [Cyanobacteriota/Melainabacteria group bacterium]